MSKAPEKKDAAPAAPPEETKGEYSADIIARLLNISTRRLYQLAVQGVIPKAKRGRFVLVSAVRGYISFLQQTATGTEQVEPDKLEPFRRKAHYQAEVEKLRLQAEAGELIARTDVESAMARTAKIVAQFFDTLPDLLERDTGATPVQLAMLEKVLDETREGIYAALIAPPETDGKARAVG